MKQRLSFLQNPCPLPNNPIEMALQVEGRSSSSLKPQSSVEKKRKSRAASCSSSNPANASRCRENKKLVKDGEVEKNKACEEPPQDYIQVRARRGQATDSHSLAERARRERISLRFKVLQGLVPGCDKAAGKSHMLDEIINYVQSLQNKVEFLSMRLASLNPMWLGLGVDFDEFLNQPEQMRSISQTLPYESQTSHIQTTAFEETTINYQMMGISAPISLPGQGPRAMSQESSSFLLQVDVQGQGFVDQVEFNTCSFQ